MSWRVVAERNAVDPVRSRSLWVYGAVYVLLFGGIAYLGASGAGTLGSRLASVAAFFVPLTALAAGYQEVAGGRQNGGLRVTLSFPHTRREVVVGTAVGRAVVMGTLVTAGVLAAALVTLLRTGVPDLEALAVAWALAVLLAVAMASFAVGISAGVRTPNRAAVLAFGSFLLFLGLWSQIPTAVRFLVNGLSLPPGPAPEWAIAFTYLNPTTAFQTATGGLLGNPTSADAFYATDWFGVAVLVGWLVVPLAVGLLRFERDDL